MCKVSEDTDMLVEHCALMYMFSETTKGMCANKNGIYTNLSMFVPPHEKTNNLNMQKQRRRSADQRLCFCYSDSTIPLLLKSEISNF